MYGIEILVSVVIGVLGSILAFFLARRSLTQTEEIFPKEETKHKSKTTKKSPKVKLAKKESVKPVSVQIEEEETKFATPNKTNKKEKKSKSEVIVSTSAASVDRVRIDSSDDWKKVSKTAKKVVKKDGKVDVKEEIVAEVVEIETQAIVTPVVQEPVLIVEKVKASKSKKSSKQDTIKPDAHQENTKEIKKEAAKEPEVKSKQTKETIIVNEVKGTNANEDMELRHRVGELMSELDRQKSIQREETKTNIQLITQMTKENETLKQKIKTCQLNEEKLMEDLKKKNSSFNDIKQQFVIVQSELTKNIVQVQAINRDKEKLENRAKSLDESNRQLKEKSEMFDKVNSENENLMHRLTSVEEEYKTATIKYNELSKAKEVESNEKINQLQSDRQRMQEQLVRVQTDLIENNSKLQNMQQELLNTKSTYTDLLNENVRLQKSCGSLENANIQIKQQQSLDLDRDRDNSKRLSQLETEVDNLKNINDKLVEENQILSLKNKEMESSQAPDDTIQEKVASLTQELNNVTRLLSETNIDSGSQAETVNQLVAEITELKNENAKLLLSIEHFKTDLENTESALLKLQTSFTEEETKWRESINVLENEFAKKKESLIQEITTLNERLTLVNSESITHKESYDKLFAELNEQKLEKDSLALLVEQYKSGLENTEFVLSNLQISVNEEEAKWRESLVKSESEAEKCSKELEKVYNELTRIRNQRTEKNELNFAYHCVDKSLSSLIDEMEARMNHFETSLEAVIQERDSALAQIHVQLNGTVNEHIESNSSMINGDDNDCEMTKIKDDLSNQIELNKSLENHCNKYRALIDIGKDALEAEKIQVQTLKDELKVLQSKLSANTDEQL